MAPPAWVVQPGLQTSLKQGSMERPETTWSMPVPRPMWARAEMSLEARARCERRDSDLMALGENQHLAWQMEGRNAIRGYRGLILPPVNSVEPPA